jgi:hypothetical protein
MTDEELRQEFQESIVLYEGRTAKDRWLSAVAAFLDLRHRVLAKWADELGQPRDPERDRCLCYTLRNLAIDKHVAVLTQAPVEEWNDVTEWCELLTAWYPSELRELRILMRRIYSTFAPFRHKLTPPQRQQFFRCLNYFEHGEDVT